MLTIPCEGRRFPPGGSSDNGGGGGIVSSSPPPIYISLHGQDVKMTSIDGRGANAGTSFSEASVIPPLAPRDERESGPFLGINPRPQSARLKGSTGASYRRGKGGPMGGLAPPPIVTNYRWRKRTVSKKSSRPPTFPPPL